MIRACPSCGQENRIFASRLSDRARCGRCKTALSPLDEPYEIPDAAAFDELLRDSPLPVVVDFWAPWCGPCHAVAPEVKKLATAHAGKIVIAKANTDRLQEIAGRYGIRGIPTLIRFDRGKETRRTSGAQSAAALAAILGLDQGAADAGAR
jgi:thioredoxin 2